ncbi:MAG: ATP-binding protein [Desulfobacterales bacterium]|nr:ATP-binding protein [Desulfobacterales bacterium]
METKPTYEKLEQMVSLLQDEISDLKKFREKYQNTEVGNLLENSDKRFRALIEEVAEISIQGYDEQRKVTFWNKASEQLYGYTEEEALGRRLEELIIPEQMKDDVIQFHGAWVKEGQKIPSAEIVLKHKSGSEVPVFSSHVMLETGGGKEMFCIDVDLSAIKKSETEKERLQAQLKHAQKMEAIGTLAGGIAHDFNNILFSIGGLSELILDDLNPKTPEHDTIVGIMAAVKRGRDLVKQILSFSRKVEHKKEEVRLQKILDEVIKLCRSTIPSSIHLNQEIQNETGYIMADPVQLHQVAMNLITNAFQSLPNRQGSISVFLTETMVEKNDPIYPALIPGPYALLKISDTGQGIEPDIMDKIFEPYFTTKGNSKGTGLGLSTVYRIVRDHNGDVRVSSTPGQGSTFAVYLPVTSSPGKPPQIKPDTRAREGTERILLIDDDPAITSIEKRLLSRLGYKVTGFVSSIKALEAFKADPNAFDLVITDMTMPQLTGDRLSEEILAVRPKIPIIICSGYSDPLNRDHAEKIGVKRFLTKPVSGSKMAESIRQILDDRT